MALSQKHMDWLESRKIDLEIAIRMGLYSGKRGENGVEPDEAGQILVFPFTRNGETVGEKYRGPQKKFWQRAGAKRKVFFNADTLDDPDLSDNPLVIVEGEMDALAVISAGFPWVVSVPAGAPPARDASGKIISVPEDTYGIDPEADEKFSYLLEDWAALKKIPHIIIATDNDEPGIRLAQELVRRLDRVRCSFVTFPDGCKDFNDVLVKFDAKAIFSVLQAAKPFPVSGVYSYSDLPPEHPLRPVTSGWSKMDDLWQPYLPSFVVVTGFPGHGKSTWTTQLATNLAYRHQWNIAIASFEMRVKPYVTDQISRAFDRLKGYVGSPDDHLTAEQFLNRRFAFLAPDPDDDDLHDIDWLLERMTIAVLRHGAKVIIIDPWNEIEHEKSRDESQTEYTGRAIKKLKSFARRYGILVIVVAHPSKGAINKEGSELGLYDISDSAHWANKADVGIVVARVGDMIHGNNTGIFVTKVRYQPETGKPGNIELIYNPRERIFE